MIKQQRSKNVLLFGLTSFFTDISSEMIFPILPIFLITILSANLIGGFLWQRVNVQAPFVYAAVLSVAAAILLIFLVKNKSR